MKTEQIREQSLQAAKKFRINVPLTLPLLDAAEVELRVPEEVLSRILTMTAIAAAAYGFDKKRAVAWLNQEGLIDSLTEREKAFVLGGRGRPS